MQNVKRFFLVETIYQQPNNKRKENNIPYIFKYFLCNTMNFLAHFKITLFFQNSVSQFRMY